MQQKILRYPELSTYLGGVSRSTIFRWCRDDQFPKPINLGTNSVGWMVEDVEKWIKERNESKGEE